MKLVEEISQWERERSTYFLRVSGGKWRQVSELEFVLAERAAGFFPQAGCGPVATAGFSGRGIEGRIEFADVVERTDDRTFPTHPPPQTR